MGVYSNLKKKKRKSKVYSAIKEGQEARKAEIDEKYESELKRREGLDIKPVSPMQLTRESEVEKAEEQARAIKQEIEDRRRESTSVIRNPPKAGIDFAIAPEVQKAFTLPVTGLLGAVKGATRGIESGIEKLTGVEQKTSDLIQKPISALEIFQQRKEEQALQPETTVGRLLKSGTESTPGMVASIGLGPTAGAAFMGAMSGGQEFLEAEKAGATMPQALGSAAVSGGAEALLSKVSLGLWDDFLTKAPSKPLVQKGLQYLGTVSGEAAEEAGTEVLQFLGRKVTYDKEGKLDMTQVLEAGAVGGLMAMILGALGGGVNLKAQKAVKDGNITESDVVEIAKEEGYTSDNLTDLNLELQQATQSPKIAQYGVQPTQSTQQIGPTTEAAETFPRGPVYQQIKQAQAPLDVEQDVAEEPVTTMYEDIYPQMPVSPVSLEMREGQRRTYPSIQGSEMFTEEAKATLDPTDFDYEVFTNEEALAEARENLGTVNEFLTKDSLKDAVDTARGIELMRMASNEGDFTTFNQLALKQAELMTKAGQAVQAQAMLRRMTPEGYLQYIAREVDKLNETGKQKKAKEDIGELEKALRDATPEQLDKIKKILAKRRIEYKGVDLKNINDYIDQIKKDSKITELTEEESKFIYDKIRESLNLEGRAKDVAIAEAYKVLEDKVRATNPDKVAALQRISMLLNIKTQSRNVIGNLLMQAAEIGKEAVAIPLDKAISNITGERTLTAYDRSDIAKGLTGVKKGFAEAWDDYQRGINTRRDAGQFEVRAGKIFPEDTKYFAVNTVNKGLNKANNLTSFLLSAGDRPFFEATYEMEKSRLERLPKYEGKPDLIEKKAISTAEERTFQNQSALAQSAVDIRNRAGIFGRLVLPYAYTPANITDKVFDYSPLGTVRTISKNVVQDVRRGEFDQREFSERLSRNLTGSAIMYLGYMLAKDGIITGAFSDDKDEREFQRSLGIQDYAFKVGDKQINFDWAQPIAVPFAAGANLYQEGLTETNAKETIFDKVAQVSLESTKTLLEQPLLQGVQELFGGYGSEGIITNVANIARTAPLQVFPGLSLLRQGRQAIDPNIRNVDYNSLFDQIRNQLPGLSQTLPYKYSTLGETQQYSGGPIAKFTSPATVTQIDPSPLEQEILDVFQITGDKDVFPKKAPKYFTKDKVRYDLTLREQSEFQQTMGTYVKEQLQELISTNEYNNMSDDSKASIISAMIKDSYDYAKAQYVDSQ